MQELFPFIAGVIIGLAVLRIQSIRVRVAVFVVLCLVFGALATYVSGESEESWGFVTVDAALVWLGGLIAVGLVAAQRRFMSNRTSRM